MVSLSNNPVYGGMWSSEMLIWANRVFWMPPEPSFCSRAAVSLLSRCRKWMPVFALRYFSEYSCSNHSDEGEIIRFFCTVLRKLVVITQISAYNFAALRWDSSQVALKDKKKKGWGGNPVVFASMNWWPISDWIWKIKFQAVWRTMTAKRRGNHQH